MINDYIKNEVGSQIWNLLLYIKELDKEEHKPEISRGKAINIRKEAK